MALGQLGDVDQALDAVAHPDEGAEGHELGDLARDDLTDRVGPGEVLPRVLLRRLERERDPLAVHVDVEHLDGDLLADPTTSDGWSMCFQDSSETWTSPSTLPRSTKAPKLTIEETTPERTLPLLQLLEGRSAHLGLGLLEPRPAGQDHVVAVLVQLDDLGLDLLADIRHEVADPTHLDRGGGRGSRAGRCRG